MTGGVAKNLGVVRALEGLLEHSFNIPDEPQIVGALGAALYARDTALADSPST
jgi:activator of 2-hydroxyglutaryl-CoA dehydratase